MLKALKWILMILIIAILANIVVSEPKGHGLSQAPNNSVEDKGYGNVLIAYFSLTGATVEVAQKIQEQTGADFYAIQTQKSYPGGIMLYATAIKETTMNELIPLATPTPDLSQYDAIIIGSPVWWFTVPAPVRAFIHQADLSGKTIIPFCTAGGNAGDFFKDFQELAPSAQIHESATFIKPLDQLPSELDGAVSTFVQTLPKLNYQNGNGPKNVPQMDEPVIQDPTEEIAVQTTPLPIELAEETNVEKTEQINEILQEIDQQLNDDPTEEPTGESDI